MIEEDVRAPSEVKTDMSVTVNVAIDGTFDGESVTVSSTTYSQGSSSPSSTNVVASDGTIDLRNMAKSSKHNTDVVHITFVVSGTIAGADGEMPITFPTNANEAVTINGSYLPTGEFTAAAGADSTQFVLTDADVDKESNIYCLQPLAWNDGVPYDVPVDPPIIDRGKTG